MAPSARGGWDGGDGRGQERGRRWRQRRRCPVAGEAKASVAAPEGGRAALARFSEERGGGRPGEGGKGRPREARAATTPGKGGAGIRPTAVLGGHGDARRPFSLRRRRRFYPGTVRPAGDLEGYAGRPAVAEGRRQDEEDTRLAGDRGEAPPARRGTFEGGGGFTTFPTSCLIVVSVPSRPPCPFFLPFLHR